MEGGIVVEAKEKPLESPPDNLQTREDSPFKRFADKIKANLQREKKTEEPKISVDFYFSAHGSKEDATGLKEKVSKCDIFVPEMIGWIPTHMDTYNDLSNGKITPQDALIKHGWYRVPERYDYMKSQYEAIYKSGKKVVIADLPYGSQEASEYLNAKSLANEIWSLPVSLLNGNFDDAIKALRDSLTREAEVTKLRENYIAEHIKSGVDKIIVANPKLREKKDIKVFVPIGAVHTGVSHALQREGDNVAREFQEMPFIYGSANQALRATMFGKEVSDELLSHAILESLMSNHLEQPSMSDSKLSNFIYEISLKFSFEEIQAIIEELKANDFRNIRESLMERIKNKDLQAYNFLSGRTETQKAA